MFKNSLVCFRILPISALIALSAVDAMAQPSGGPYGPIQQTYSVPADAAHVYYVAPDGKAEAKGATPEEPTSLDAAIANAVTGDAIILRGGTYRTGGLTLSQGATLQPYANEHPVLKGTKVAADWEPLRSNIWRTKWTTLFPQKPADWWQREREGMRTPLHKFNNDMVFMDGHMLQSAGWEGELNSGNFCVDYEHGYVFIGFNPTNHLIEITAFDSALTRKNGAAHGKKSDGKGATIRGLTFTQYAYRALEVEGTEPEGVADPSTYGKDVVGSTFENVTISCCSRVAGYFRGDRMVFRNCLISDTSTEGIYILASSDCLLERNIFARNNVEHITGYFPAAVKIFNQTHRVVCRDNLVIEQPESNGIWYDVGNQDGVFINNWVENCVDGFFFEISKRVVCAGNVFVNCDKGVRILNSTNAQVYHNTLVNSVASFERTERSAVADHFGWHPATGPSVEDREGHVFAGNLLVADAGYGKALFRAEQSKAVCGRLTKSQLTRLDDNVYVRAGESAGKPLLAWGPVEGANCTRDFGSLEGLRRVCPDCEAHGLYLGNYYGSIFKSPELKNLRLNAPLACPAPVAMPAQIQALLGWSGDTPGAYPR